MKINIVGLGPAGLSGISLGAYEALMNKELPLYLRTGKHSNIKELEERGMKAQYLDYFYEKGDSFEEVYEEISQFIIDKAEEQGELTYGVPGHPCVAERTVELILEKAKEKGISVNLIPSMSFIDASFAAVQADPSLGFTLVDALSMEEETIETKSHLLITQVYDDFTASDVKLKLLELYEPEHSIALVKNAGSKEGENPESVTRVPLEEMDRLGFDYDHLTSVFVPGAVEHKQKNIRDLIEIVRTLRGENGCPWDKKQTHESLKENIVEEAVEVREAIEGEDIDNLIEELGDVLLQIIFHSELGKESGYFNLSDVTDGICRKLIFRHPHVFSGLEIEEADLPELWQKLKNQEKNKKNIEK